MATKRPAPKAKVRVPQNATESAAKPAAGKSPSKRSRTTRATSVDTVSILRVSGYDVVVSGPLTQALSAALEAFILEAKAANVISICEMPGDP